jgi:hypothetical protein
MISRLGNKKYSLFMKLSQSLASSSNTEILQGSRDPFNSVHVKARNIPEDKNEFGIKL